MGNTESKKNNLLKKFQVRFALGLVFLSFLSFLQPTYVFAKTGASQQYLVQFLHSSGTNILQQVGTSIKQRFVFSQSPEFSNIFSFSSNLSLVDLEKFFVGQINYLQFDPELANSTIVVNDPGFTIDSTDINKQWGLAKTKFNLAWEKTTGATSTVVAIVDTGVDETHLDLEQQSFVPGFNFLTDQSIDLKTNSDDNGHGTLVAGVLGAVPDNGVGIAGTNWKVGIMPLKALDSAGRGDSATIAEAIVWATDHGARIINLSLGGIGLGHDTTLSKSISYAFNHNEIIIAAAGNDVANVGSDLSVNPVYPVCDDNGKNMVIGVAATDQNDFKAPFSNYGGNCIDVSAPGKWILSTINHDPTTNISAPNSYAFASGTSMAAPFVSGLAALLVSANPNASNVFIRDRIINSADSIDSLNSTQCNNMSCAGLLGSGRINAQTALAIPIPEISKLNEGDLVQVDRNDPIYLISGGQKDIVSPFVLNQRYRDSYIKTISVDQANSLTTGSYALPLDGTLVKTSDSPTVYEISQGQKLPITYQVFEQRNFNFSNVQTLSDTEVSSWSLGSFLPFAEGTLVKTQSNSTIYWVVGQNLHPVNSAFYLDRELNIFPLYVISDNDLQSYPKGEAYVK